MSCDECYVFLDNGFKAFEFTCYPFDHPLKHYAHIHNMNNSAKRIKCCHDAWFPIPPHDVLEVNNSDAVFDWKHADGFYMEVMIQGGVWEDSIACLGLLYLLYCSCCCPNVGCKNLLHTGRRLGN